MRLRNFHWLPISALIFYICVFILWKLSFIPSPSGIFIFLENLYNNYGLFGLFIASFLEGIVYFGLYFPGSFIIILSVILSNGSFISLFLISLVVAGALTLTSIINYILGKNIVRGKKIILGNRKILSKGLFISMLYPNSLAFYFFHSGIKGDSFWKVFLVPFGMIPYGLFLGYLFYSIKESVRQAIESPYIMISLILIWLVIDFIVSRKNKQNYKP
jgi:hypothetical protein